MSDAQPSHHIPVLLPEVLAGLAIKPGDVVADMTFGAGGYTEALLAAGAKVLAFDRDGTAIAAGRKRFAAELEGPDPNLRLIERSFEALAEEAARVVPDGLDAVVFDLGVSSMQLDRAERGFSFLREGPLDMRMGAGEETSLVSEFVHTASADDLKRVFWQYGEEKRAGRLAAAIVHERARAPFQTTTALAAVAGAKRPQDKIHPATRMFQALRIFINDELGQLIRALLGAEKVLKEGGRLAVVTFHSLEDRIVKRFLSITAGKAERTSRHMPAADGPAPSMALFSTKPQKAGKAEADDNPRARSAKLRLARREAAPPIPWTADRLSALGAPSLVFSDLQRQWSGPWPAI
ncbi:MAG: 16S rRNA (cytosine(1402)-N(4))-methyltransferase RsmH [Pseudomonadota bacterium]